jgi:hypothetical protein
MVSLPPQLASQDLMDVYFSAADVWDKLNKKEPVKKVVAEAEKPLLLLV